jgi:hypothetical protein
MPGDSHGGDEEQGLEGGAGRHVEELGVADQPGVVPVEEPLGFVWLGLAWLCLALLGFARFNLTRSYLPLSLCCTRPTSLGVANCSSSCRRRPLYCSGM